MEGAGLNGTLGNLPEENDRFRQNLDNIFCPEKEELKGGRRIRYIDG